jgi:hypothetical protein
MSTKARLYINFHTRCRSTYIGKTDRCLYTRLKEHNTQENTDINAHINCCEHFQHIKSLMEHSPNSTNPINTNVTELIFRNCKIIDTSDHWSLLLFKESLAIRRRKPELNHGAKPSKELLIFHWHYAPPFLASNSCICNFTLLLILRMTTNKSKRRLKINILFGVTVISDYIANKYGRFKNILTLQWTWIFYVYKSRILNASGSIFALLHFASCSF